MKERVHFSAVLVFYVDDYVLDSCPILRVQIYMHSFPLLFTSRRQLMMFTRLSIHVLSFPPLYLMKGQ